MRISKQVISSHSSIALSDTYIIRGVSRITGIRKTGSIENDVMREMIIIIVWLGLLVSEIVGECLSRFVSFFSRHSRALLDIFTEVN